VRNCFSTGFLHRRSPGAERPAHVSRQPIRGG
jgi:hypothetical protein